jgi:hypothetical protein
MDQRGKTPDRQKKKKKKSRRGHGCLSVECCVLSGRGLCDELVPRPEESKRLNVAFWMNIFIIVPVKLLFEFI